MRRSILVLLLLFAVPVAGCAAGAVKGATDSPGPLVPSLQVTPAGDTVGFTFLVTNGGSEPVELAFVSGQEFDVAVWQGTRELWRWSADRMFTQALHTETLLSGETRRYTAQWHPSAGVSGELTARATLAARDPVEQATSFRLP